MTETTAPPAGPPAGPSAEQRELPALTRRDLNRSFWRYYFTNEISWNYERMQALPFAWIMIPVLRRLYAAPGDLAAGLQRHLVFFNTNPILGMPLILGSSVAMEEAGAPGSAEGVKVGMMGPLAAVGDTLVLAIYNTIILTIASVWAIDGNIIGPIFGVVFIGVPYFLVRRWQFFFAYRQGRNIVSRLATGALEKVNEGMAVLGLIVLGGFIPSIVRIVTTATYTQASKAYTKGGNVTTVTQKLPVQAKLDLILPYMIPVAVVALAYLLLKRFKLHPVVVMVILAAIGVGLGWYGWFAAPKPS